MILIDDDRLLRRFWGCPRRTITMNAEYYAHADYTSAKAAMDKLAA